MDLIPIAIIEVVRAEHPAMSQSEMARALGMKKQRLSHILMNEHEPRISTVQGWLMHFNRQGLGHLSVVVTLDGLGAPTAAVELVPVGAEPTVLS